MIMVFIATNIVTMEPTAPGAAAVAVENLDLVADRARNFAVSTKDRKVQKNLVK